MKNDFEIFLAKIPFFRLLIAFIAGILFQLYVGFHILFFLIALLTSVSFIVLGLQTKNKNRIFGRRWIFGAGAFLFLFSAGLFITQKTEEKTAFPYLDKPHSYLCKIIDLSAEKQKSVSCKVKLISNIDENKAIDNTVIIYLAKDSASLVLKRSEYLLIDAKFTQSKLLGNPYEFDYNKYLKYKGVSASAYVMSGHWQKFEEKAPFSLETFSWQCQQKLLSLYKELGISGDEFAVLAALTLGYTNNLTQDVLDNFSAAGTMHVLSVSGLHVAVIYMVFNFILSFLDKTEKTKIIKIVLIIFLLWFYAFITGLSLSVIRSAAMLSLVCFATLLKRKPQIYNTIFISAFGMLAYNPYYLFDVGFQLSYTAVLSIIYFQPKFYGLLHFKNRFLNVIWLSLTVSFAAQLGTTPIVLFYFHQFSNYFWLANLIVVPAGNLVIYSSVTLLLLNWVPYIGTSIAFLLTWLIKGINVFVLFIHQLPYSVTGHIWIEKYHVLMLFLIMAVCSLAFVYRNYKMFTVALGLSLSFACINLQAHYQSITDNNKIVIAAMQHGYGVSFIKRQQCFLLTNNFESEKRAMNYYRIKNKIEQPVLLNQAESAFISFGGKNIFILTDNKIFNRKTIEEPIRVDYMILTNKAYLPMKQLLQFVVPKQIIIDLSYYPKTIEKIKNECELMGVDCFSISENGAFIAELQ